MAKRKSFTKKSRLTKQGTQTKWAPFWIVLKASPKGRKVHPSMFTRIKRNWRRTKIQQDVKCKKFGYRKITSGSYKKKF